VDLLSRVLELVSLIPRGRVTTYAELARAAGRPGAWRAVGNLLSRNPRPIEIPCHRVVRSDGRVGGYSLGEGRKVELLREEGVEVRGGRVDLDRFMFRFSGAPAGGRSWRGPSASPPRLSPRSPSPRRGAPGAPTSSP